MPHPRKNPRCRPVSRAGYCHETRRELFCRRFRKRLPVCARKQLPEHILYRIFVVKALRLFRSAELPFHVLPQAEQRPRVSVGFLQLSAVLLEQHGSGFYFDCIRVAVASQYGVPDIQ